jgi:hypothetical protein
MQLTLSKRSRRKLTALLIGYSKMLPRELSPIVARLRDLALDQERRAKAIVTKVESSPFRLTYHGFTIVELFPIELLTKVTAAGVNLVPSLDAAGGLDEHKYGTMSLGTLFRTAPVFPMGIVDKYRVFPKLPSWVDRIELSLSRVYDATFIVIADVITTPAVDGLISARLRTPVEGAIELNRIGKLSHLGYAHTQYSEWAAYSSAVQGLFNSLRIEIQRSIFHRYFPFGYFASHARALPAVELLEIVGDTVPPTDDWIKATDSWRHTIGLDFDRDYYSGDNIGLGITRALSVKTSPVWRIVFRPMYSPPRNISRTPVTGRESAVALQSHLRSTLHFIAIAAYQGVVGSLLAEFRRKVFLTAQRRLWIPQQTKLYEAISREWILFERSKRDLTGERGDFDDGTLLKSLAFRTSFIPAAKSAKAADVHMHDSAVWWYDQLTVGFSEIRSYFADVLAARSYGATFVLTLITIGIALLSLTFSVVALKGTATQQPAQQHPVQSKIAPPVPAEQRVRMPARGDRNHPSPSRTERT